MIMLSKFSNFPDELSENDELKGNEINGSDCTGILFHNNLPLEKNIQTTVFHSWNPQDYLSNYL